ncbi:trypsin-like serine protease [Amycolatopsis azurea]|uniref:trypsin-like serine protease n=1 Tax=Amycolatopsis azurea TaxID=36819 RepID=UPI003812FD43
MRIRFRSLALPTGLALAAAMAGAVPARTGTGAERCSSRPSGRPPPTPRPARRPGSPRLEGPRRLAGHHFRGRAEPVKLAGTTPADGTPVRILGWGAAGTSCDDFKDTKCFPGKLREADTEVVPLDRCWDDDGHTLPLCVGRAEPPVGPGTTDSGGPALIRSGDGWTLARTVIGPGIRGADFPDMYTDVAKNSAWLNGIVTGTDVPPLRWRRPTATACRVGGSSCPTPAAARSARWRPWCRTCERPGTSRTTRSATPRATPA